MAVPPLPRLVLVLQRSSGDLSLASWQLQNDSSLDVTPGVPGIADALAWMAAYASQEGPTMSAPTWPNSTSTIVDGGPIAPAGGTLVNTGLFLSPPAGQWTVYQVATQLVGRVAGTDAGNASMGQGSIAFSAAPGNPAARLVSGAMQTYAPAVPQLEVGVITCTAAGELLIGVGNGDAVNAQSFELLTIASGPIALP